MFGSEKPQKYHKESDTVPIDKILSVKNACAWVPMVSYFKKIN